MVNKKIFEKYFSSIILIIKQNEIQHLFTDPNAD